MGASSLSALVTSPVLSELRAPTKVHGAPFSPAKISSSRGLAARRCSGGRLQSRAPVKTRTFRPGCAFSPLT
eukprot:1969781-Pyramimonas_sp.AAC.1